MKPRTCGLIDTSATRGSVEPGHAAQQAHAPAGEQQPRDRRRDRRARALRRGTAAPGARGWRRARIGSRSRARAAAPWRAAGWRRWRTRSAAAPRRRPSAAAASAGSLPATASIIGITRTPISVFDAGYSRASDSAIGAHLALRLLVPDARHAGARRHRSPDGSRDRAASRLSCFGRCGNQTSTSNGRTPGGSTPTTVIGSSSIRTRLPDDRRDRRRSGAASTSSVMIATQCAGLLLALGEQAALRRPDAHQREHVDFARARRKDLRWRSVGGQRSRGCAVLKIAMPLNTWLRARQSR